MAKRSKIDVGGIFETLLQSVLALADTDWLNALHERVSPIASRIDDPGAIFEWLLTAIQYQGVADTVTTSYIEAYGLPTWEEIAAELAADPACDRLRNYWHFAECGYTKAGPRCASPALLPSCPLPAHRFRNGRLSQAAFSLFLFVRDICDGDVVGWIDDRLAMSDGPTMKADRAARMRAALLDPLRNIFGVSDKVLSLALADFLLVADPSRERWVTTGASMIVIDSLVHNFLTRTGILHQLAADHTYGPACYAENGCADAVETIAAQFDAHVFDSRFPAHFPRFIQKAIWQFCAAGEHDICNGNRIDDRHRCDQLACPVFDTCARIPLRTEPAAAR